MINQIIISSTCCCLQFCCKELAETAYKLIGRVSFVKIMYTLIYFFFIVVVYLTMYLLRQWEPFMNFFAKGVNCMTLTQQFDCISASVIYRITLSLFIFSIIMIIVLQFTPSKVGKILNEGLFLSKFILSIIIFFLTLQLSNEFITYYEKISQIFSYVFIIWQIIIVIDLCYLWGIKWAQKYSEGRNCYGGLLIGFTILNYFLSIGINVYGYIVSYQNQSSQRNQCKNYPNILSTLIIILMFGIQLLNYNKQNSLIATSSLSIFTSYWLFSAIFSNEKCNNSIIVAENNLVIGKSQFLKINIPISIVFVILSSFGSIYGSSNQEKNENFIELKENIALEKQLKPQEEQQLQRQKRSWLKWHIFMTAMSLYISMVCSDWGSGDILNGKFQLTLNAQISKVFTSIVTVLVYLWTLIAPKIMPSRNFYFT